MKWQPIETAPEKAERYLVTDGYEVREARYMPRKTLWKFPSAQAGLRQEAITHWMPLPPPPGEGE